MDKNIIKGKVKQAEGKIQETYGKVTGNVETEVKGDVKQAAGNIQEQFGKTKDAIKKANDKNATK